jgi:hypothetical protein
MTVAVFTNSNGDKFAIHNTFRDSAGVLHTLNNNFIDSTGASFVIFGVTIPTTIPVVELYATDKRVFIA